MTNPAVRTERAGPVTTVVLTRPNRRNAVDRPTADALVEAFLAFDRDPPAAVAVFSGEDGAFCAGADLKAIAEGNGNRFENPKQGPDIRADAQAPMGPSRLLLSKPVIAAIAGPAVAGGLELALWCDMRVAEEDSVLGVFCRRWGVPLIDGGTVRLPRLIGMGHAMDLILTGRAVSAREALAMGLVNRVVAKGTARMEAEKLAAELAHFPQVCMRHDRLSAYQQWDLGYAEAMANEFAHGQATLLSGEALSGAGRFASGKGRGGSFSDI
ncbi:MAG: crotonase/enoyl-CoA hydratase family protein [Alphaproteobacteria bacterium]|nr:crotonase/enoyl-CoA hydratase family protein [Alphaproteobacteria bacterium]